MNTCVGVRSAVTVVGTALAVSGLAFLAGGLSACARNGETAVAPAPVAIPMPTMADAKPRDYPGLHNVVAYREGFLSGSVPEGDAGFDTLKAMGVKTIITVDGAVPEVDKAEARGIRYIHLPIGYGGFDDQRKLQLVRATRDSLKDGPVYIHCHHGKHRSAGAAAAIATSLGWMTSEQSVARMQVSGTAPNYTGLYACASNSCELKAEVINAVSADFPSISKPSSFVQAMVEIDEVTDHLKAVEKAGWTPPADHPDLVPVAEAGRLADLYRVLAQGDYAKRKPADFTTMLTADNDRATKLEDMLAAGEKDAAKLSAQFKLIVSSCKECHATYRD